MLLVDKFDRICNSAFWKTDEETLETTIKFYCDMVGDAAKHECKCIAVFTGVTAITCKGLSSSLNNITWRRFLEDETFCAFYGISKVEFKDMMSL